MLVTAKPVDPRKFPYGVSGKAVGSNSIKSHDCDFRVYKYCTDIKALLKPKRALNIRILGMI